jgi:hypothetical protein
MRVFNGTTWQPASSVPDTLTERSFVATAGQTSYTFTGGYRVDYTFVWVNGALLSSTDITATDGTTITFASALAAGDEVRALSFKAVGTVAVADITGLQTALDAKVSKTGDTMTGDLTVPSLTDSGNLTFTGTGNRITGDFSNATIANRVMFQTSTVNGATVVEFLPNGTGTVSGVNFGSSSDLANTSILSVSSLSTDARFNAGFRGTGTYLPMTFYTGGSERMRVDTSGNVGIGTSSPSFKLDVAGNARVGNVYDTGLTIAVAGNSITYPADNTLAFNTNSSERARIDSSGNVGIGTSSPGAKLDVRGSSTFLVNATNPTAWISVDSALTTGSMYNQWNTTSSVGISGTYTNHPYVFVTNNNERARIDSSGNLLVGTTNVDPAGIGTNANGIAISPNSYISMTRTSAAPLNVNRKSDDGDVVTIRQDGTTEGTISVSGTTVSYNAFAGSHWSQLQDGSKPEILRGTVMESIDELCQWPDEPTSERLCRSKISDTAGSKRVYGVFMDWDNDWTATNDMLVTSLGAFICRVNAGVTVQMGDLLESNGDGTARVQADDIIRSSTIGKVTGTAKTHEYDDGSYCVPTVLYCG